MATAGKNEFIDEQTAKRFFGEVRKTFEDEDTERASFRGKCGAIKQRRKSVYERAESSGIPAKILKARITQWIEDKRIAEAKARRDGAVPEDIDDRAKFQSLCEALGDFRDLPLGAAAVDAAKPDDSGMPFSGRPSHDAKGGGSEPDVRPRHIREQEAERERLRENGERVMKGIKKLDEKATVIGLPGADATEA
jgi:hypothetical protein